MVLGSHARNLKKLGKAQAREQFAPLIQTLATKGGVIEVTDYGKVAAVMLGYKDYLWLLAQARGSFKPTRTLAGSAFLVSDLEKASMEISEELLSSIENTAREL
jgi:hypothetical protein